MPRALHIYMTMKERNPNRLPLLERYRGMSEDKRVCAVKIGEAEPLSEISGPLICQFADSLSLRLSDGFEYQWEVSVETWSSLKTGFDPEIFSDAAERNRQLKHHIACRWEKAPDAEKLRLARWIIADWGGIRSNHEATIKRHVVLACHHSPRTPIAGIASYSKILAFSRPRQYAIYDARVAAALNAVQIPFSSGQKFAFPYLQSRNSRVREFARSVPQARLASLGFVRVAPRDAYRIYLNLLKETIASGIDNDLGDLEMILFSDVEHFIERTERILDG
jgi:hypothetical protein